MRHEFKRSRLAPYLIRPLIWQDFTEERANEQCDGTGRLAVAYVNQQSPVHCTLQVFPTPQPEGMAVQYFQTAEYL